MGSAPKPGFTALRFLNINVNGLCSKINFLAEFLQTHDVKLACITETHLFPYISNSVIDIPHFSLVRNDVAGPVSKHGVCVYVHDSVMIDSVDFPLPNILTFRLTTFNVYVVVVYRPPSNMSLANNQFASFIGEFCLNKEAVVLGDFNLPNISWHAETSSQHSSALDTMFTEYRCH